VSSFQAKLAAWQWLFGDKKLITVKMGYFVGKACWRTSGSNKLLQFINKGSWDKEIILPYNIKSKYGRGEFGNLLFFRADPTTTSAGKKS
jgi:hypothetical protein